MFNAPYRFEILHQLGTDVSRQDYLLAAQICEHRCSFFLNLLVIYRGGEADNGDNGDNGVSERKRVRRVRERE